MMPASSILLILSAAAGAERLTRRPNSLWVSLALSCSSSRMRHPVVSNSLSFFALIPENSFVSGHSFAKHILLAIPKTWFSLCTRSVPPCRDDEEVRFGHYGRPSKRLVRHASPGIGGRSVGSELPFRQVGTGGVGPGPRHALALLPRLGGLAALRVAQGGVARARRPASVPAGGVPDCAGYLPGAVLGALANRRYCSGPDRGLRPADSRAFREPLPGGEAGQDRVVGGRGVGFGRGAPRRPARRLQRLAGRRASPAVAPGRGRMGAPGQAPGRWVPGRARHRLDTDFRHAHPSAGSPTVGGCAPARPDAARLGVGAGLGPGVLGGHLRTVELGRGPRARLTRRGLLEPRAAGGGVAGGPGPWGGVGPWYGSWRRAYHRRRPGCLAPQ